MKVTILGLFPFPRGSAPAKRVLGFARALAPRHDVRVLCSQCNTLSPSSIAATPFVCDSIITSHTQRWFLLLARLRLPFVFVKAILARRAVARLLAGERPTVLLSYNQDYYLSKLLHANGFTFIQQYCERKLSSEFKGGRLNPHYWSLHTHMRHAPDWSSADIVISRALRDSVRRLGKREPVIIPPLMLESPQLSAPSQHTEYTFTYLGAGAERDLVPELLTGASSLFAKRRYFRLLLVGLHGTAYTDALRWQAENGAEWLTVRPFVEDGELEEIRSRTDAWVLLRRNDASGQAAFPTRLCEYLVTPKPVLFSDVGDLALYTGDEGAVLVAGEDASDVEAALLHALEHRDTLQAAARNRMRRAAAMFSPDQYVDTLHSVITTAASGTK